MPAIAVNPPFPIFTDADGQPLDDAYIYIGTANQNPVSNPITVYWDSALTIPAAQPIRTSGGCPIRSGTPARFYTNSDYSILVRDKNGAFIYTAASETDFISSEFVTFAQAGAGAVQRTSQSKLRDIVSVKDFGAVGNGVTDDYAAIAAALASGASTVYFPKSTYLVSQPIVMNVQGLRIVGDGPWLSIINQTAGFSGVATVNINGSRLQTVENLFVGGNSANGSDAIRITNGQLATISNVVVKFGVAGIRLISGNNQKWSNVFAESNQTGFLVVPDSGDNTNGCTMLGLRSVNHSSWGLDVQQGAGATGHMHSTWNISAESGSGSAGGIRIRGGRYCYFDLYAESNPGSEFDLPTGPANYYFLKNPNNEADNALFNTASYAIGVRSAGGNLYWDGGWAPDRYKEQAFSASGSLAEIGVKMWDITNTSGGTRNLTLSFLTSAPIGFRCTVTKRDNTAGFTLVAPGGITLVGDTGTFGAFAASVKRLEIQKINATTAICIQSGT